MLELLCNGAPVFIFLGLFILWGIGQIFGDKEE